MLPRPLLVSRSKCTAGWASFSRFGLVEFDTLSLGALQQPTTSAMHQIPAQCLCTMADALKCTGMPASRVAEASRMGPPPGRLPIQPQKRREREGREISHQRQRTAPLAREQSECAGKGCLQSQTGSSFHATEISYGQPKRSQSQSAAGAHICMAAQQCLQAQAREYLLSWMQGPPRTGTATVRVFWLATRMSALRMPVPARPPCTSGVRAALEPRRRISWQIFQAPAVALSQRLGYVKSKHLSALLSSGLIRRSTWVYAVSLALASKMLISHVSVQECSLETVQSDLHMRSDILRRGRAPRQNHHLEVSEASTSSAAPKLLPELCSEHVPASGCFDLRPCSGGILLEPP